VHRRSSPAYEYEQSPVPVALDQNNNGIWDLVFVLSFVYKEFCHMAEIAKLSAGKALDKLRGANVPESKSAHLDEEIKALDRERERLRAVGRRIERDQRGGNGEPGPETVRTRTHIGRATIVVLVIATSFALALAGYFFAR
jgi:hypothetical protein